MDLPHKRNMISTYTANNNDSYQSSINFFKYNLINRKYMQGAPLFQHAYTCIYTITTFDEVVLIVISQSKIQNLHFIVQVWSILPA